VLRRLVESKRLTRKELAHQVGLSERTLYRRLKALGLA
jgi:transcriptional antiterminator